MGNGDLTKGVNTFAPTTGQPGHINKSWKFGYSTSSSMTAAATPVTTAFTFEGWFIFGPGGAGITQKTIWGNTSTDNILVWVGTDSQPNLQAQVGAVLSAGFAPTDGLFHHLVITASGVNVALYLDNVSKASGAGGKATYSLSGTNYFAYDTRYGVNTSGLGYFDEIAIYNTALSPTRVAAHYNAKNSFKGWGIQL